jgi:anthranilate/para-aminobenzoate synthase component I
MDPNLIQALPTANGSFLIRSGDKIVMGFGVAEEWRAYTLEQAEAMLKDLRKVNAWRVGYLSYELGSRFESVIPSEEDPFKTPLLHFVVPEEVYVYDAVDFDLDWLPEMSLTASSPEADWRYQDYVQKISLIHQALQAGDTYEVNLAHRFSGDFGGQPLEAFRRLQRINPSPHACYLNFAPVTVVSSSPERLLKGQKIADRWVVSTRPIKGTAPRGKDKEEDERYIKAMLEDKKVEAELNMIVDLARNDLGKVCEVGSVEVNEHRVVESYSHVHHTLSNVRGVLREELDWLDALRAVFPGGSITGAPKRRTIEIIDRLETVARGVYTGSAGWISPDGEFDFNILIRTIAFQRSQNKYAFHSGGAIVMDSLADMEWRETLVKAAVLEEAIRMGGDLGE